MSGAKDIVVRPISATEAREVVRRVHYSGKVVNNSTLHLGVYYAGKLEGAMQFGPPMVKAPILALVRGTEWSQMLELNRMAFGEALPRNSESRALAIAFRMLRKHRPDIKWILSFADGTQCGDGTIYRASGFVLTDVKLNRSIVQLDNGQILTQMTLRLAKHLQSDGTKQRGKALTGYQFRYIKFLDPTWVDRLTVPVIPFDQIPPEARMYRGQRINTAAASSEDGGDHPPQDGATPIQPLREVADV